jgi:hypothetical protein
MILEGTKTDHGEQDAGRVVPVPATLAWMLEAQIQTFGQALVSSRLLINAPKFAPQMRTQLWRDVRGGVVHAALSQGRVLAG